MAQNLGSTLVTAARESAGGKTNMVSFLALQHALVSRVQSAGPADKYQAQEAISKALDGVTLRATKALATATAQAGAGSGRVAWWQEHLPKEGATIKASDVVGQKFSYSHARTGESKTGKFKASAVVWAMLHGWVTASGLPKQSRKAA